ncbi:protein misato [Anopheles cruzii]|uniref:protein misato n=1 Tax=Anopheles cruzii TaxID=68878 RepID=UPI0022EC7B6A|nr:protein misato [Anopheles cruzii]
MVREVLTFQLGHYANHVGTHWWNIQESSFNYDPLAEPSDIDHAVLYREGATRERQMTFTPRLLMVDLAGTLRHLPRAGDLYADPPEPPPDSQPQDVPWDPAKLETIHSPGGPCQPHPYQTDLRAGQAAEEEVPKEYDFAETAQGWVDYSYARFHPRSINIIERYAYSPDECQFDTVPHGALLWQDGDFRETLTDRTRQYVEECDQCQGFQMLFDCGDAFGGLAAGLLEHLHDEYGKPSLVFPVFSPNPPLFKGADETTSDSIRTVNTALTFAQLPERCSLFAPLATMEHCWRRTATPRVFPHTTYGPHNLYQTAAILAAFLDTVTLQYRLRAVGEAATVGHLAGLCSDLTQHGRQMVAASLALPFAMDASQDLIDCLDQNEGEQLMVPLSPAANIGTRGVVQSVCMRGIPENRLKRPPTAKGAQRQQRMAGYRCGSVSEMLQLFFSCTLPVSMSHVTASRTALPVNQPFPIEMFTPVDRFTHDGFLTQEHRVSQPVASVTSVPTLAALQSSTGLGDGLEKLHHEAGRVRLARIPRFTESGLEAGEFAEALEHLLELRGKYDEGYEL